MKLLSTITRPDRSIDSHFKDGILAMGWEENASFLLCIRQLSFSEDDTEAEIVMDLGHEIVSSL